MTFRKNNRGSALLIVAIIAIIVIVVASLFMVATYNGLVTASATVDKSWSEVRNQYQRQADLIPNLVSTANGYMKYEQSVLTNITQARTNWLNSQSQSQAAQDKAGTMMNLATGTFLSTAENYPDLKADTVMINLMDELSGTQNRITVARGRYIENIASYNIAVRSFPSNLLAGFFSFAPKDYYQGSEGIEAPPTVTFP